MPRRAQILAGMAGIVLATLVAGDPATLAETADPRHDERPGDPEAPFAAAEDSQARSPAGSVTSGPYVSVQVNVDTLGNNIVGDASNEPSIAVNPVNHNNMVIGWRHFATVISDFRQAGRAYTFNGGMTWRFPGVLTPGTFRSDPVVGVDLAGNFFFQSLKGDLTVDVFRSVNGGVTWGAPVPSFGGDKNWMAIDQSGGPGSGLIYGIWHRIQSCCGTSVFTRSTNGGASFQTPVTVALLPTFGTMDVGPDGKVYAAGINGTAKPDINTFVVSRSSNAQIPGAKPTFSAVVAALGGAMAFGGPNPAGFLGQANVVVDKSTGPTRGYVYLLASVAPFGVSDPLDVHISRSIDGGITWSGPVRVNDDPSVANWQWFGAIAVAPNGRLDVVWNDTRNSGQINISQLFYAWSYDAGATWSPNVAVSPPFDSYVGWPDQLKIGDYLGIASDPVQAHVAYAATFNGEQDIYYVRVFPDCNHNGVSDETDAALGTSPDRDGNRIPDECQTLSVEASPRSQGFWKRLCKGPHPEGQITQSDVECVNDSCAFGTVHTVAQLCDRLNPEPSNDKCEQAEAQFMALMLNRCQGRIAESAPIVSDCTSNATVSDSVLEADSTLCSASRDHATCTVAQCESEEINTGRALQTNSLRLERQPDGALRLSWQLPYGISDLGPPRAYLIQRWRFSEGVPVSLAETTESSWLDLSGDEDSYQYVVTPLW